MSSGLKRTKKAWCKSHREGIASTANRSEFGGNSASASPSPGTENAASRSDLPKSECCNATAAAAPIPPATNEFAISFSSILQRKMDPSS